jgi:hypothetical protein
MLSVEAYAHGVNEANAYTHTENDKIFKSMIRRFVFLGPLGSHLVKKSLALTEPEGSLLC